MQDESHHAVADVGGPVGFHPTGSSDRFEPSPKLRARIEKLAHWKIDPSYIHFKDDRVSYGGHATVSKGALDPKHGSMRDFEKRALGKDVWIGGFRISGSVGGAWPENELDVGVKKTRLADDTDFERILGLTIREAEILAKLDHRNIVELEGFVEDVSKGIIWLVFPWADYGNLKDFTAREKWDIPERISLISDVAKGLEYLHSRNPPLCHGDLKSLNVLIYGDWAYELGRERMYARITDFGSARSLPQRAPDTQIEDMVTQLSSAQPPSAAFYPSTKTITLSGNKYTLRWAAPELLLQDQISLWSDIWALGWIAYEVMTESLPFEDAASEVAVVERVVEGKLPSLTDNTHLLLIDELCSLMNMCWEVQPTLRPTAASCRRTIDKMPMFAPEIEDDERILDYDHLRQLGQMYQSRGDYARAFTFLVEALHPVTGRPELKDRIQSLRDLAQLARITEEYGETIAVYDVIWEIYEWNNRKDMGGLSDAFYDLAELHRLRKEKEETRELHWEGQKIQERQRVTKALCAMAENHRREGTYDKAIQLITNALKISTDLGDRKGRAHALWGLAKVHRSRREDKEAIQLYSEVLEIRTDLNDKEGRASALWGLADVHRSRGEYEKAVELYSEVLDIRTDHGDTKGRASALLRLADVHRRRNEYEKAVPLYSEILEIHKDCGNRKGRASTLRGLADVHRRRGEYEEAIPLYLEVLRIRTDLDDRKGRAEALWGLADVHRRRSEYEKAIPLYSEVSEIRTDLDEAKGRADALQGLAEVHRLQREYEEATRSMATLWESVPTLTIEKEKPSLFWALAILTMLRGTMATICTKKSPKFSSSLTH